MAFFCTSNRSFPELFVFISIYSPMNNSNYKSFSEDAFWKKVVLTLIKAGEKVINTALLLFFAFQKKDIPLPAKAIIAGALGYFIVPFDIIPDFLAGIGYTDDLATLLGALSTVALYIDGDVKKKAENKMKEWFGEDYKEKIEELK